MFNSLLFLVIFFVLIIPSTQAQVSQQWVQRYGGPGGDHSYARKVVVDKKGNVYVTGNSWGDSTNSDYTTIKYNSSGVQKWIQRYSSTGNNMDISRDIVVDNLGNVYITGYVIEDFGTIKYDSAGVQQWVQIYNGPANGSDRASTIALDESNNVYVTGYSQGIVSSYDFATIKYNSQGIQQWIKIYNGPANYDDVAYSISIDSSENIIVCGQSVGAVSGYDYATIKYNSAGLEQWIRFYNGTGNSTDAPSNVIVDNFENIIVCGSSVGIGTRYDCVTIKYNSSGDQQWIQRYNGLDSLNDIIRSINVDSLGNVYGIGFSTSNGTGDDILTLKYNSEGFLQWTQRYNYSDGGEGGFSLALGNNNSIYITGSSEIDSGQKNYDYVTIKYNSSGIQQWVQRYDGPGNGTDVSRSIAVDNSGGVYVTGNSLSSFPPVYEFATIKYSQTTNITNENSVAFHFSLFQNYPNPFNPTTTISFALPKETRVTLKIYDVIGKEVAALINNEIKQTGIYNINFDGNEFASGIYYYKLDADEFTDTQKMILLK